MTTNRPNRNEPAPLTPIAPWNGLTIAPLPQALTPLIGREREAAVVVEHFRQADARLVTLTGSGGIGKTRLAIELAHRLEVELRCQVAFVGLEAVRQPAEVVPAILREIGLSDQGLNDPLASLASALLHTETLLILDNFEQVLPARSNLVELLTTVPLLRLLVTSRTRLGVRGEQVVLMPPLGLPEPDDQSGADPRRPVPDSMRLFIERATAAAPGLDLTGPNAAVIGNICRRLDGVPLAIELAAARTTHLSVATLDDRLGRSLPLLVAGAADLPERHRALRDTIAWSYDLLDPEQQRLFRQIAVFRGGFSLEAAEAVMGSPVASSSTGAPTVIDGLQALVEASLVMHSVTATGVSRYSTLETIAEFAQDALLAAGEREQAHHDHAAWYLAFAESLDVRPFSPEATDRSALLAAEQPNMAAALDWLLAAGDTLAFGRLVAALTWSWWVRGDWRFGRPWLDRVWDEPSICGALPSSSVVSLGVGYGLMVASGSEDAQRSDAIFTGCLDRARADDDVLGIMMVGIGLGWMKGMTGDTDDGVRHLEETLRLARSLPPSRMVNSLTGIALNNLAAVHRWAGRFPEASSCLEQAYPSLVAADHRTSLLFNLIDRSYLARDMGAWTTAESLFREAIASIQAIGDQRYLIGVLEGIATVFIALGDPGRGVRLLAVVGRTYQIFGMVRHASQDVEQRRMAEEAARSALGEDAYRIAAAEGAALYLDQAIALASEPRSVAAEPSEPGLLTRRETEILQLLAGGLSNREIAARLFIGERTIESHLERIYAKLGVRRRVAAIAAAARLGLVDPLTDRTGPDQGGTQGFRPVRRP